MFKDISERRKIGLMVIFIGIGSSYFAIYEPLELAHRHEPLEISKPMIVISSIGLIYGITYILFPKFVEQHLGYYPEYKPASASKTVSRIFAISCLIFGVGVEILMQYYLKLLGYDF